MSRLLEQLGRGEEALAVVGEWEALEMPPLVGTEPERQQLARRKQRLEERLRSARD
jgi:hypothetical protein